MSTVRLGWERAPCPAVQIVYSYVLHACLPCPCRTAPGPHPHPAACLASPPTEASAPGSVLIFHQVTDELVRLIHDPDSPNFEHPPFTRELMRTWVSGLPRDPTEVMRPCLALEWKRLGACAHGWGAKVWGCRCSIPAVDCSLYL